MKIYLYAFYAIALITASCNQQDKSKTIHSEQTIETNPKVEIKVNRTYDSKGNLIKYDSLYSYIYTTKGRDSLKISTDSLFNQFKSYYKNSVSHLLDDKMKDIFFNDSLFIYDFPNEDYFSKRFELNSQKMKELFITIDSLKNTFLKENKNLSAIGNN